MKQHALWLIVCTFLLVTTGCSAEQPDLRGPVPIKQLFDSPAYGIHTSFWWKPDVAWRDLDKVKELHFQWVKQPIAWRNIENNQVAGAYDWYRLDHVIIPAIEERGLRLMVRLDSPPTWALGDQPERGLSTPPKDPADFGRFCFVLADRYKGRIHAYQVWNEPNLSREWGDQMPDPIGYTALLKACYEGVKSADPDAIVVSAGLAPTCNDDAQATNDMAFLEGMYKAGAAAYFDVLGVNAPGFNQPPEAGAKGKRTDQNCIEHSYRFRHVEEMRQIMLDHGDGAKQVAILEMGWITNDSANTPYSFQQLESHANYEWFAVSAETQATYLVDAYRYAREHWQPWIGLMTTIYIADYTWTPEKDEQWWWSIMLPDGTLRPAFHALAEMDKSSVSAESH